MVTAQTARHHYDTSSIRKVECGPYCSYGFHCRLYVVTAQTARLRYDTSSIRKGECVMNASKFYLKVNEPRYKKTCFRCLRSG